MSKLSTQKQQMFIERISAVQSLLKRTEEMLNQQDGLDYPLDNVIRIVPHIEVENELFLDGDPEPEEILANFEKWSMDIALTTASNLGYLDNEALNQHLQEALNLCRNVEFAFKLYLDFKV